MKKTISFNYLMPIFFIVFTFIQSGNSTPPTFDIITRVENPQHFESLAVKHSVLKEQFNNWQIKSVSTPYMQKKVVSFFVNLIVPGDFAPNGLAYEYGLAMKFSGDSLINYEEIKADRLRLKDVINLIENNKAVRTFRCNADVYSEYLYWNGGSYIFEMRSKFGDTLVTATGWPASSGEGFVWRFSFNEPHLLDIIELFLNKSSVSQLTEFRSRLGLGYARLRNEQFFFSSGKNCEDTAACFIVYHSWNLINAYKLPMKYDWSSFPYFADAVREANYFLLTQGDTDCLSTLLPPDAPFAIMCHQQNTLPRRVYIPIKCKNKLFKILSIQLDNEGSKDPHPILHDVSILDSLLSELRWDK